MSHEHPDMSGNPCDMPFYCTRCGDVFSEWNMCGSRFNQDATLCTPECANDYDDEITDSIIGVNYRKACDEAGKHGLRCRITSIDGEACIVTQDFDPYRLNVAMRNGVVSEIVGIW